MLLPTLLFYGEHSNDVDMLVILKNIRGEREEINNILPDGISSLVPPIPVR
jgi:hypothetical protein